MAHLQDSPFEILKGQRVEAVLANFGWQKGEPLPETFSIPDFAKTAGADAVLRCRVTDWGRTYALVESWVKAEVQAELVDGKSGEVIWSEKKKNEHQAGVLKGPTGYASVVTAPIMGMRTSHLERVAEDLMSRLAKELAESPAVQAYAGEAAAADSRP